MRNLLFSGLVIGLVLGMATLATAQAPNCYPGGFGYSGAYGYNGFGYSGPGYGGYRGGYGSYYGSNLRGPNVYGAGIGYTSGFAPRTYTYGGPGLYPSRFVSGYGGYGGPVQRVQLRYGY